MSIYKTYKWALSIYIYYVYLLGYLCSVYGSDQVVLLEKKLIFVNVILCPRCSMHQKDMDSDSLGHIYCCSVHRIVHRTQIHRYHQDLYYSNDTNNIAPYSVCYLYECSYIFSTIDINFWMLVKQKWSCVRMCLYASRNTLHNS